MQSSMDTNLIVAAIVVVVCLAIATYLSRRGP